MSALFSRLESVGIPRGFARSALPGWWDDEISDSPSGLQQAQLYLARAFNLDVQTLASPGAVQFRNAQRKYKLSKGVAEGAVLASAQYATAMAKLALIGCERPQIPLPPSPDALRQACLKYGSTVGLDSLLRYCVDSGVPVLHIENLPGLKMYGLVVRHANRYAIVISRKGAASEILFWLAHEIGHIACGHLQADGFVADEKINADQSDTDEDQADAFAIWLLNGKDKMQYVHANYALTAEKLAIAVIEKGNAIGVDPGHIALNYAHGMKRYGVGKAALKLLPNQNGAERAINESLFRSFGAGRLSEDQLELLAHACQVSVPESLISF
ncbi:ImmA/IrrE family metallo-endopeptidase [Comamonas thiooxydans]|uniref:ImmA/IrrE family metallo-endopeptidase n=1 Tax=Comamonas thiooxydans TaxID=363952 RepID=UPI0021140031|nr:ImmA/IrrE family metallo-endopeptidase [Comamonas thiooxydans]UUE95339.1 ImmA/IrrE family metallo-endopeptidase [Comamonas thiooxydans]